MIVEAVAGAVEAFVILVVGALPISTPTFPSFGPIVGLARQMDTVLPVHEALYSMGGLFALAATVFAFQTLLAIYKLLPFKGT